MGEFIDLIGKKFGKLIVVEKYGHKEKHILWLCQCDCGNKVVILGYSLRSGDTKSCGCLQIERVTTHGHNKRNKRSLTYSSWAGMIQRCTNPNNISYKNYGGRSPPITVCDRWDKSKGGSFANFLEDMGNRPKGKSLDKINNNKNYCKLNCKWSTPKQQNRNRRDNRLYTFNNKTQCIKDWAKKYKMPVSSLRYRIDVLKFSIEKALMTPVKKRRSLFIRSYEQKLSRALRALRLTNNNKISFSKCLPYNSKQLYDHLENIRNFQSNSCPMCHISYDINPFDIDHIVPTFTAKTREELLKLFNLENLSPLCYKCNRYIKRDKIIN